MRHNWLRGIYRGGEVASRSPTGWGTQPLRIQLAFPASLRSCVKFSSRIPYHAITCRPSGALVYLVYAAFYKHAAPLGLRRRCLSPRPIVWVPHPLRIQFRFPSFPSSASFALLRLCVVFLTYYASRLSFLPFPFSRFLTPSPPRLLVFSFARFGYFFVSFFYIPTFCWLGSYYFLLRGRKHRFSGTNLLVFYLLALSLPIKCRIIFSVQVKARYRDTPRKGISDPALIQ